MEEDAHSSVNRHLSYEVHLLVKAPVQEMGITLGSFMTADLV